MITPKLSEELRVDIQEANQAIKEETGNNYELRNIISFPDGYFPEYEKTGIKRKYNNVVLSKLTDDTREKVIELEKVIVKIKDPIIKNEVDEIVKKLLFRTVLYIGSECERKSNIGIDEEYKSIKKILNNQLISIKRVERPTIDEIILEWEKTRPEIVFFSCHGDEFGLYLQNEEGKCVHYSNTEFIKFFRKRIKYTGCVILSSCESLNLGKDINRLGFDVICINRKVNIKTATKFNKCLLEYITIHSMSGSKVYRDAFIHSEETVKFKGLKDSFSFDFLEGQIIK